MKEMIVETLSKNPSVDWVKSEKLYSKFYETMVDIVLIKTKTRAKNKNEFGGFFDKPAIYILVDKRETSCCIEAFVGKENAEISGVDTLYTPEIKKRCGDPKWGNLECRYSDTTAQMSKCNPFRHNNYYPCEFTSVHKDIITELEKELGLPPVEWEDWDQ